MIKAPWEFDCWLRRGFVGKTAKSQFCLQGSTLFPPFVLPPPPPSPSPLLTLTDAPSPPPTILLPCPMILLFLTLFYLTVFYIDVFMKGPAPGELPLYEKRWRVFGTCHFGSSALPVRRYDPTGTWVPRLNDEWRGWVGGGFFVGELCQRRVEPRERDEKHDPLYYYLFTSHEYIQYAIFVFFPLRLIPSPRLHNLLHLPTHNTPIIILWAPPLSLFLFLFFPRPLLSRHRCLP